MAQGPRARQTCSWDLKAQAPTLPSGSLREGGEIDGVGGAVGGVGESRAFSAAWGGAVGVGRSFRAGSTLHFIWSH